MFFIHNSNAYLSADMQYFNSSDITYDISKQGIFLNSQDR